MSTAFSWNENHVYHASARHPERPERIRAILDELTRLPLWRALAVRPPLEADRSDAALVHSEAYLDRLETATAYAAHLDPDTYTTHRSLEAAYSSLGAVLAVADAVLGGVARNGFAAARPPGHHATPDRAMGFCLLSNAAIAARWAQRHFGVGRIAIVDFDVHHGNGTQDAFYDAEDVLYLSTHEAPLYPGSGGLDERGSGPGLGTTVNVPLPAGAGDGALLRTFESIFEPIVLGFGPQLIIASAGYDAHWRDPLARLNASMTGYSRLVSRLMSWADACSDGRLVVVLEGGYDLQALATSVAATISRLIDHDTPIDDVLGEPPIEPNPALEAIERAGQTHVDGNFTAGS